jgi:transposase
MKRKVFSKEVKLSVVNDLQAGKTVAEVCREYEVKDSVVRRWRIEYRKDPQNAFSGKGVVQTSEAKLAESQRLVGQLYAETQLLKKALENLRQTVSERR